MSSPITRSFFAWGILIAKKIPYNATLKLATIFVGRLLPATIPDAVPSAQHGSATKYVPYIFMIHFPFVIDCQAK